MGRRQDKTRGFCGNRYSRILGWIVVLFLACLLGGGFYLALLSIRYQYTGALACWTICATPIGTAVTIVLGKTIDKEIKNVTGPSGEGMDYTKETSKGYNVDSAPV